MEEIGFWIAGASVLILGPWALAIVALVKGSRARTEAREALAEAQRAHAAADEAWRAARAAGPVAREAGVLETRVVAPGPETPSAPAPAPAPAALRPTASAPVPHEPAAREPAAHEPPAPGFGGLGSIPAPAGEAPGPAAAAATATPRGARAAAIEEKIALVWFTRAGAVAVLLGAAYFLKYAIDNAWLGPWGRIALACLGGAACLVLGEALRPRTRAAWIHALQGAGLALLFLAAFGSHALYRLVPAGAAFAAVAAAALLGGALAVRHRAELLLALALAGGMLAPVVLSTGEDRPLALFGYLLVLAGLALAASVALGFRVVPWLALGGSAALFAGWYLRFFETWPPPAIPSASLPADEQMGRYFPLARRAVPLAAAVALSVAWLAAWARARRSAGRGWSDAWLAASLLFVTAAPFALVHDRPILAGAALAAAGIAAAALLEAADRAAAMVVAEVAGFGLLALAAADRGGAGAGAWVVAAALVALAHLAPAARAWLRAADRASPALTAAVVVAGVGFAGFALWLTRSDEGVLRAALVGAAGAAELAVGAARVRSARARASVLLGASLGLLAGAAALLFSGATVTVAWAVMGAVAAVLGARERDRWWIAGACLLLAAALLRIALVDAPSVRHAGRTFLATLGAAGRLQPRFLLNPRAVALAATAAALLVSGRTVARAVPAWRIVAGGLAAAGWAAVVALAVSEAMDLARTFPPPPAASDAAAFHAYGRRVFEARLAQEGLVSMVASLVMAACAALLVAGGFVFRDALHRRLGLALFAVVLAKLLLFDVWGLSRLQQVAVFVGVGALLLAAAFLYARLGRRLEEVLRGEGPRAGGALLVLAAALGAPSAAALDASAFARACPLDGVQAPGLYAVEADAELLRASRAAAGTLGDVRIEGPGGIEVPWTLRVAEGSRTERAHAGTVVDPVRRSDGALQAVVDLGPAPPRHGELRLDLSGAEFLRAVRLEVSSDGRTFGTLTEGERVWAIRDVPEARHTAVRHPASEARFVRVTLLPGAGDPDRITGASAAAGAAEEAPLRAAPLAVPAPRRSPDGRETLLDADLGAAGLPVEALELEIADAAFERHVHVLASADAAHWVPAGGGVAWRAPLPAGAFPAARAGGPPEGLRVAAATGGRRFVRVAIADGDSPPLTVAGLRVLWRPREIVFRVDVAGAHTLLVGADVAPPAYDLAALLARSADVSPAPARVGPAVSNPRHRAPVEQLPFSERHRGAVVGGLAALFAALALWAVRLLRSPPAGKGGAG